MPSASVRSRPKTLSRTPPIEFPSSRVTSSSSESLRPDPSGPMPQADETVCNRLDEARRPAHEHARTLRRSERDLAQQVEVDPVRVPRPAGRLGTGQRVHDLEAVPARAQLVELLAVDDLLERTRRVKE